MSVAPIIPSSLPLIVGTEQIAAAARHKRRGPVCVIEPPVDTVANTPTHDGATFRACHGLGDGLLVVLVSRLAQALKLEGLRRAIEAVGLLARHIDVRLVIVGDGPARSLLAQDAAAVNAGTGTRTVTLTGELADPRSAYAAGDVVLGMGSSALRAMAFEKPVVVLGERGYAELLSPQSAPTFLWQGLYGLGDGSTDAAPLAVLIESLLIDPARRRSLGMFARGMVESRFGIGQAAQRLEQVYADWAELRPSPVTWATEAITTATLLLRHKIAMRLRQHLRLQGATEDFNSIARIAETASTARGIQAR